ncbi:hypothetical protein T265_06513 [Opisthorchis viverrini]|uniref:Uncharacterized protein n=1 Tax=Opisthorchis viverrini TaxID=6198 RepID=A0A074ZG35_OPIVI|nr:hypothetical protein T265_06513 [Opisthorchis viverrini]KER26236.1 hypothetical protein T265_06513 [Opisthorchis viverrini]
MRLGITRCGHMCKKINANILEPKRLLRPLEAYVLLPDRLCNVRPDEALSPFTPCMVDLITTALKCCGTVGDTALVPVSWMKLKLDPDKMISVVAAVIPSLNGQPCYHILKTPGADRRSNKRDLHIFETIACVAEWDCEKLLNLQVVIILPWPDPSVDVFDKSIYSLPTAHKINKAILEGGPVTVGGHQSLYRKYYFDLNQVCAWNCQVLCVSDWFAQSTAELTIALLACLNSGILKVQCIDFAALAAALRYGSIRGAAITTPTVWTTQLTELDELRNLPNTFVLPPSTSSACTPREIRQNLAHHVVELIAESLYYDNGKQLKDVSQDPRPLVKIRKIPVPILTSNNNLSDSRNESPMDKYAQTLLRVLQKLPLNRLGAILHKHWKLISDGVKVH